MAACLVLAACSTTPPMLTSLDQVPMGPVNHRPPPTDPAPLDLPAELTAGQRSLINLYLTELTKAGDPRLHPEQALSGVGHVIFRFRTDLPDRSPGMLRAVEMTEQQFGQGYPGLAPLISALPPPTASPAELYALIASATHSGTTAMPGTGNPGSSGSEAPPKEFVLVPVLYATNRAPVEGLTLARWREAFPRKGSDFAYFGGEHDRTGVHYGLCTVSVPAAEHEVGGLERPAWYETESLIHHVTLRGLFPLTPEQMRARIARLASRSAENDAFVFVHGFNVSFNAAAMRTAQIAYDFGFGGAPILFSWPSRGQMSLQAYNADAEITLLARDPLYHFLNDLALQSGLKKIHLVAHSMGNRVLLRTLQKFREEGRSALFGEIILTAPDVMRDEFEAIGPAQIAALCDRLSLYASSRDAALIASRKYNGRPRIGQSGAELFVAPGLDTIDASDVNTDFLAHGYFSNAAPVISDIARLLQKRVAPNVPPRQLVGKTHDNLPYWWVDKTVR